jgi:membrane protein implicated in regulation of membrane protease activity
MLRLSILFPFFTGSQTTGSPIPSDTSQPNRGHFSLLEFRGEAIVDEPIHGIHKRGRVRFNGSWWPAKCDQEIVLKKGQTVAVVGIDGITLLVQPLPAG